FTLDELDEITAYAHRLTPRRRVFVTVNTLIRQDELPELAEALVALDEIGVDAVILQDLGVYRLLRTRFPKLELHASTQLSVHNRAGAETLKQLGFRRVVLARELTFEEVRDAPPACRASRSRAARRVRSTWRRRRITTAACSTAGSARTSAPPPRPTCRRSSAARGRGCSCSRTRTRRSRTATRSATAARPSAR